MNHLGQITIELFLVFILLIATKILGKTQISQLTPFDFISAIVLGELVGNTIYDPKIKIWSILYAVLVWVVLIYSIEVITQKFRGREVFEGSPSIIIRNGYIDREQLSSNHLDINQLQQMLRQQKTYFQSEKLNIWFWNLMET